MLKLWFLSVRALDDVRAAVRESGETLARGVRSLTSKLVIFLLLRDLLDCSSDPLLPTAI